MNILKLGPGGNDAPGSIAVSADARQWVLLNASPEAARHAQVRAAAAAGELAAIVLLDGRFEHTAGLPVLCELAAIDIYATPAVFERLTASLPTLGLLDGRCGLRWHLLPVAGDVRRADFRVPGAEALRWRALAADGAAGAAVGEHLAVQVEDLRDGRCLAFEPSAAAGTALRWVEGRAQRPVSDLEVGR